jgi:hypothetical protein
MSSRSLTDRRVLHERREPRGARLKTASVGDATQRVRDPVTARQFERGLALRQRLQAILDETEALDVDTDVPGTLTRGLLEDVDRLLNCFEPKGDKR